MSVYDLFSEKWLNFVGFLATEKTLRESAGLEIPSSAWQPVVAWELLCNEHDPALFASIKRADSLEEIKAIVPEWLATWVPKEEDFLPSVQHTGPERFLRYIHCFADLATLACTP